MRIPPLVACILGIVVATAPSTARAQSTRGLVPSDSSSSYSPTLPDAPSASRVKTGDTPQAPDGSTPVPPSHVSPRSTKGPLTPLSWRDTTRSKTFWAAHGIFLAATVYDVEITHAGLAHHRCVEAGENPHPSRGELYASDLPWVAGFTVADLFLRKIGVPFGYYVPPAVGSIKHIRGGTRWLSECW